MIAQFALTQTVQKKTASVAIHHSSSPMHVAVKHDIHAGQHDNGNGNGKKSFKKPDLASAKKVRAEDMIPMNEEALKQF
jgi:hypothetical protein